MQAALCVRDRGSDCQTSADCSFTAEGCEGEGGRGERKQLGREIRRSETEMSSPHTCAEHNRENEGVRELNKRGLL